jgi:hypothetical protein
MTDKQDKKEDKRGCHNTRARSVCSRPIWPRSSKTNLLVHHTGDQTSGDGAATLTDVEALTSLGGDGAVSSEDHLDVVTGLDAAGLVTIGEGEVTRLICNHMVRSNSDIRLCGGMKLTSSAEVDLGAVVGTETGTATTLSLGQNVHGDQELLGSLGAAGLGNDHTTANVLTADTTEQQTRVVTGAGLVTSLLEGLDIGDLGLDGDIGATNNLNLGILLQQTTLNTAGGNGTTAGDGEDLLNGHEEGLVKVTLGGRNPSVNGGHQSVDTLGANVGAAVLKSAKGGTEDDRGLLTLEAVGGQKLTHLELDELKHLRVINGIDLVDEDDDLLDTDLTGEQQVLTSLGPGETRNVSATA